MGKTTSGLIVDGRSSTHSGHSRCAKADVHAVSQFQIVLALDRRDPGNGRCISLATWVAGDSVSSMATTDLLLHKAKRKRLESFLAGRMS